MPQKTTDMPKLMHTHFIRRYILLILKATKHINMAQHSLISNDKKSDISPINTTNEKNELNNAERISLYSLVLILMNFCVKDRIQ